MKMPTVGTLLEEKEKEGVISVPPRATILQGQEVMRQENISSVLVLSEDGELMGIVTERDITRKVELEGRTSSHLVSEIMTHENLATIRPTTSFSECLRLMDERKIRHLPVTEGGKAVGLISDRDVMRKILETDFFHQQLLMEGMVDE